MISNEGREFCRGIGLLAEHIICMADSFEEPIEKFRKSLFYSPEFEDKGKIIQDSKIKISKPIRRIYLHHSKEGNGTETKVPSNRRDIKETSITS